MAETERRTAASSRSGTPEFAAAFSDMGKKQIEAMAQAQKQVFDVIDGWNRNCLAHVQSEATLASDTATKLMNARSVPEAATAYYEWVVRRTQMMGEESQRFLADSQKLVGAGWQSFSNGQRETGA